MKLRVLVEVDLDDGAYSCEMSDDEGRLSTKDVPKAIVVVARVMEHILDGRAEQVASDTATALKGAPDRSGFEN